MDTGKVIEHFAKQADDYERLMTRLVPQYLEQSTIIESLLPTDDKAYKVLDLGCGNGILSKIVLNRLPHSHVVAFDVTKDMLMACERKLSNYSGRYDLVQGDYSIDSIGAQYDIVLAGLTLHHLSREKRREFYRTVFSSMLEGGLYIARDIIIDEDPEIRRMQYDLWKAFMKSQGEDPEHWFNKHMEMDHPITLTDHFMWLRQAGFTKAGSHWRYYNFAITTAKRGASNPYKAPSVKQKN
jgi:tRNA (cmo5U34)-methyltransferase